MAARRHPGIGGFWQQGGAVRHEMQGAGAVVDGAQHVAAGVFQVALPIVLQRDDGVLLLDGEDPLIGRHDVVKRVELHPHRPRGEVERTAAVTVQGDGEVPHLAGGAEAPGLDVALGHRLAVLVLGHVLLAQRRQGDVLQIDDALGIVDGAGDVAPDPPIPHRIVGSQARAPGQDQALGGDAGVGQLPGALADADGLAAAVGVVDRGGPAEQDRRVHVRQRPQGQHDRAGGQIDHTGPV